MAQLSVMGEGPERTPRFRQTCPWRHAVSVRRIFTVAVALVGQFLTMAVAAAEQHQYRMTGPTTQGPLALYFIHGPSTDTTTPLTLQEGLTQKLVLVERRADAQDITLENTSEEEVFIQSGDTANFGDGPQMMADSLLLPPRSGATPITSYCLGSTKQAESTCRPLSLSELFKHPPPPSRATFIAALSILRHLREPLPFELPQLVPLDWYVRGAWRFDSELVARLEPLGNRDADTVGYAYAINGTLVAADVYRSHALFLKMWPSLLRFSLMDVTLGIGHRGILPSANTLADILASTDRGTAMLHRRSDSSPEEIRSGPDAWRIETRRQDGSWVVRTYLGKKSVL
jgi:hypothetical protein